ncbi:spondin domain-containing protein [Ferrimonas balearica]|uniref:spondin domain-containing protein n=1 Tax=Ferrimonas balearica TaxID=44012 RepID=UPI001C99AF3F|nr:spondin domain-containing protein [Ferrimonas balearica]MBY5992786.1 spondin domain-containing protein [Ferrimonas balearica]
MNIKPLALSLLVSSTPLMAQEVTVEITNLTQGIYFTPLLVSAHDAQYHLFEAGTSAGPELQAMAEGGDIAGLLGIADSVGAVSAANPAEGLLGPATTTTASLANVEMGSVLSITAMVLPSNDGFVGLDSWAIPTEPGTYTIYLNAYDAGTEANDELIVEGSGAPGVPGMPANPGGNGGTGGTGVIDSEPNTLIHIHRGTLGDNDPVGGPSDLDSRLHRWLNPVARAVITVQ